MVSIAATVDAPIHLEDLSGRNKFTNEIHALHRKCADHPIKVSERCQWANPIPGLFTPEGGGRTHVATFLSFSKKPHRRRDGEGGSPKPPLQMPPSPRIRRPTAVAVLELLAAAIATNPTFSIPPFPSASHGEKGSSPLECTGGGAEGSHFFFPREGRERVPSVFHSIFFFSFGDSDGNAPSRGIFFFLGRRILRTHPVLLSLSPFLRLFLLLPSPTNSLSLVFFRPPLFQNGPDSAHDFHCGILQYTHSRCA